MKKYIQMIALLAGIFGANFIFAQTSTIYFNTEKMGNWTLQTIPSSAISGEYVLATSNVDRGNIIVDLREGRIARVGTRTADKEAKFVTLIPMTTPCRNITCTTKQVQNCYLTSDGTCFCVCGNWITGYPEK